MVRRAQRAAWTLREAARQMTQKEQSCGTFTIRKLTTRGTKLSVLHIIVFQFISGVAVWCPEAQAKATVLTMVDMDSGYVGVLMVSGESSDNFTARSSSSLVDELRAEKTRLRYNNEPAMRSLAEKVAAFRHPRTTILEPINRAEHQSVGGVERAHQSIQAATRALRLDNRTRTGEDVVLGHALFQWMLRHAAWSHNRFQPQSHRGGTPGKSGRVRATRVLCFLSW